ncbi:MAG: hypothetical protein GX130_12170 [Candidatus Hydrogenedens sp.]|nr:hypothetical protein [Candidatus Hydrogenedens sp.]
MIKFDEDLQLIGPHGYRRAFVFMVVVVIMVIMAMAVPVAVVMGALCCFRQRTARYIYSNECGTKKRRQSSPPEENG